MVCWVVVVHQPHRWRRRLVQVKTGADGIIHLAGKEEEQLHLDLRVWRRNNAAADSKETYFAKYRQRLCTNHTSDWFTAATSDVVPACNLVVMNSPEFAQVFLFERGDWMVPSEYCSEKLDIRGLLDRFFILLSQPSKMTPTVKVEVLCVMGVIAEHHPAAANPYSDKLLSLYLGELKMLRKSGEGKERTTLAGCLQGLAGYLHSFGTGFDTEPDDYFLLFSFVKNALVPNPSTTRYDVPRAALILLSKHAALFGQLLLDEYKTLYKQIGYWSHHGNREMKVLGVAALESFLREYFIQEFQQTLKSETNTYNLAAALKGYALLWICIPWRGLFYTSAERETSRYAMDLSIEVGYGGVGGRMSREPYNVSFLRLFRG
ncbi:hypothetical protein HPB52_012539 [Rhipicephalus sanguineus]|uniref:DNA-PKcs N-terminal domain-containing protein n=1 Tax=Rhipicephalus sanguineus TaxID=34632 RepID=A0A9D4PJB3_RHISA|nr:hypothetical protein HPB52_012539 [Rhipicephalus sanguineus]